MGVSPLASTPSHDLRQLTVTGLADQMGQDTRPKVDDYGQPLVVHDNRAMPGRVDMRL